MWRKQLKNTTQMHVKNMHVLRDIWEKLKTTFDLLMQHFLATLKLKPWYRKLTTFTHQIRII